MFKNVTLGIIGGGNIGSSLIGGLIRQGFPVQNLYLCEHHQEKASAIQAQWGISLVNSPQQLLRPSLDVLLLAIKPSSIKPALLEITASLHNVRPLIISVAAGITTKQMLHWLNQPKYPFVRAMPNTPALYAKGVTALYANKTVTTSQRVLAGQLLSSVGTVVWLPEEEQLNVVTGLSGSGPAYFFYIMEALIDAAVSLGIPKDIASKLTLNTALGSAFMAIESGTPLNVLRENVTSKGGTTEQGIKVLKDGNMDALLRHALEAAVRRSAELSTLYN